MASLGNLRREPADEAARARRLWFRRLALVAVAALVVAAYLVWAEVRERRALLRLPADERAELYRRTQADVQALCSAAPGQVGLHRECQRRARFLLKFPECQGECRAFAQDQLTR